MNEALGVVGVFALVLIAGLVLRQWSRHRIAEIEVAEERDLADLADPSRWPAPPPGSPIPPNAELTFEIELVDFLPLAEVQRRAAMIDQMMGQQAPPEGEGGAAAPAPAPPQ